jgi:hypothetical protein
MRRIVGTFVCGLLVLLCVAGSQARAALLVSIDTVTASPGDSGFLNVNLTNDFATSQTLLAFSIEIQLAGSGVTFTGVDEITFPPNPYILDGIGTGSLSSDAFPNTDFIASDIAILPPGFVTLAPGVTYGLGRIAYAVDGGASGGLRTITIVPGNGTSFLDADANAYADADVVLSAGGISVLEGSPVTTPEPASLALWLLGGVAGLLKTRRSRLAR